MLAWKLFGNGETPSSTGKKGDHLVGDYYVIFEKKIKSKLTPWLMKGFLPKKPKKIRR
jgi:arginyl-tRNA synthetase